MTLVLLANTAQPAAAMLTATDTSDTKTDDAVAVQNVAGGDRRLAWSSGDTAARRVVYVNKDGGLGCTHIVLARADWHAEKDVSVLSWSDYPSNSTPEFETASFAEELAGPRSQDCVLEVELTDKQAIGISFNSTDYVKHVYKFFPSVGLPLTYADAPTFRGLPYPSRYAHRRQMFLVDSEWRFFVEQMTRAELDAFEATPEIRSEPVFLHDPAARFIHHKLLHGLIVEHEPVAIDDDTYQLRFTILGLSQWV